MEVLDTIEAARSALRTARAAGQRIGFVPTMGALHAGHASLIARARFETDLVMVSIFVNPLQFSPGEDLARYPRPFERDTSSAEKAGADLIFAPSVEEMYPHGALDTKVSVPALSEMMEGASRPGHFDGVATVVAKLFNVVGPSKAYFGEKDWQQLAVVRRMVADLSFPVEIIGCPTIREPDGLAMSSRNAYLDAEHRAAAVVLQRALGGGRMLVADGERSAAKVASTMWEIMASEPLADPLYASVVDAELRGVREVGAGCRLLVAAQVGPARLIDNEAAFP